MSDQDSMDDTQEFIDHDHEDDQKPATDGFEDSQELNSDQEHETADEQPHDNIYQDSEGDPEVVLETIEQQEVGVEMTDHVDESREHDETTMNSAQIDGEPIQGESTNGRLGFTVCPGTYTSSPQHAISSSTFRQHGTSSPPSHSSIHIRQIAVFQDSQYAEVECRKKSRRKESSKHASVHR
jgi:hypothetical protein